MKPLDVHALFPHKRTGRNTFGEVRGPEQTDWIGVDMSLNLSATGAPRVQDRPVKIGDLMPAIMARIIAARGAA